VDLEAHAIGVLGGFGLSDPDEHIPWTLFRDGGCEAAPPPGYVCPARDRLLTGADLDPESFVRAPDGTFWFGDEFGPYVFHTDASGRLLEPPVGVPGIVSPSNPEIPGGQHPGSRGFEGIALSPNGRTLYGLLEGATVDDAAAGLTADLRIIEFRVRRDGAEPTGQFWRYRREHPGNSIGDMVALDRHRFLVIERDGGIGPTARFKAVYLIDTRDRDHDGYVDKALLLNLLAIPDPAAEGLPQPPTPPSTDPRPPEAFFSFPFETIEGIAVVDDHTVAIVADNNFPNSGARSATAPDPNELVVVRLDQSLDVAHDLLR
jgi:hypothetical protein